MKKCYISGKIGGLRPLECEFKFMRGEVAVSRMGMTPVNPLRNGLKFSAPWALHMIIDIFNLSMCSHVYFLRDWCDSRGAKIEYKFAKFLKKKMLWQEP